MSTNQHQPTDAEMRLLTLFRQIEDENIREIIADVVAIERKHRTSSRKNFPLRDVRTVIDRVAHIQESQSSP